MEYQIEPLSKKNLKDLVFLYKAVFGNNVSFDFVRKKFDTSYLIENCFGHLAYFDNKPVAFHGAIPVLVKYKNQFELSAQYGDAMTLKNHTGKGLFTKLGKLTDIQLQKSGIKFVWGFPNQNSEYGYINKLNWKHQERMQGFKVSVLTFPVEKLATKLKLSETLYQKHLENTFKAYKIDKILEGSVFANDNIVSTYRNKPFYKYRSFTKNFVIEVENVLFWIKINNGLLIGDIEAKSKVDFLNALEKLKKIASKSGVNQLIFQASPNTQISNYLKDYPSTTFESWIVGYKNFNSNFPLEKLKFTFGDLDTF